MPPLPQEPTLQHLGNRNDLYQREWVEALLSDPESALPHLRLLLNSVLMRPEHYTDPQRGDHYYALCLLDHLGALLPHEVEALFDLPGETLYTLFRGLSMDYLAHLTLRGLGYSQHALSTLLFRESGSDYSGALLVKALGFLCYLYPQGKHTLHLLFRELPRLQSLRCRGLFFKFWAEYGTLLFGESISLYAQQLLLLSPSPFTNPKRLQRLQELRRGPDPLHPLREGYRRGATPTLHERLAALHSVAHTTERPRFVALQRHNSTPELPLGATSVC